MIKAFFDESYSSQKPRMFVVAGIVAQDRVCDQVEAGWRAALDEKNRELESQGRKHLSRYHAAEMNAHSNEFGGWSKAETLLFTEKLLSVIRGRDIFILSFGMILDDMVKVFPQWAEDPKGFAYGYAFLGCLTIRGRLAAEPISNRGKRLKCGMTKASGTMRHWTRTPRSAGT